MIEKFFGGISRRLAASAAVVGITTLGLGAPVGPAASLVGNPVANQGSAREAPAPKGPADAFTAAAKTSSTGASASAGGTSTSSSGGDREIFGIEPASASGPNGLPNLSFSVTPGAVFGDYVAAVNYSSAPVTVQIYATDAEETSGGGFGLSAPGVLPTGVGSWIGIPATDATITIPPAKATGPGWVVVPIEVRVPLHAEPGDHAGGIVASLQTVGRNGSGQNIVLNQRVGTRVLARVSGPLQPKLAIDDLRATYEEGVGSGTLRATFSLANDGNTDLAVDQVETASGVFGARTISLPHLALLLPGSSVAETGVIRGVLPEFPLHVRVTARSELTGPGPLLRLRPVTASTTLWYVGWAGTLELGIPLILVIGCVWLFVPRSVFGKRRRKKDGESSPEGGKGRKQAAKQGLGQQKGDKPAGRVDEPVTTSGAGS